MPSAAGRVTRKLALLFSFSARFFFEKGFMFLSICCVGDLLQIAIILLSTECVQYDTIICIS